MGDELIIVGIDGSDGGRRALRWALDEAARTGAAVEAVTAWTWKGTATEDPVHLDAADEREAAERVSAREIDAVLAERRDTPQVARSVVEGAASRVLAEAARSARMLVLGSHGHSRFYHSVLGSVSADCVRAATCPVVVVPTPHSERQHIVEEIVVRK